MYDIIFRLCDPIKVGHNQSRKKSYGEIKERNSVFRTIFVVLFLLFFYLFKLGKPKT